MKKNIRFGFLIILSTFFIQVNAADFFVANTEEFNAALQNVKAGDFIIWKNGNYTDLKITCTLGLSEPSGQENFDTATNQNSNFIFDELGLKSFSTEGPNTGMLLTHVIFHPVQKSLNRLIQIDYTIRIQSLSNIGN